MLPVLIQKLTQVVALKNSFRPAKLWNWVIWNFQNYIWLDLVLHNRLHIDRSDLQILRNMPAGLGVLLTPNHADETDFKVCVELSRQAGRHFFYMMASESFKEGHGIAGWWLQRLGAFSVERGGEDVTLAQSKRYAIDLLKRGKDVLVIFPEGEIYYLNDLVQPLKSGAVDIGMKAVVEARQDHPDWTAYLVPMAIKYRYSRSIVKILDRRIQKIEKHLNRRIGTHKLQMRLALIIADLLHRQELVHNLKSGSVQLRELNERIQDVRQSIMQQLEEKYPDAAGAAGTNGLLDRSWKLSKYLRGLPKGIFSAESLAQIKEDLATLVRIAQMASWQPEYVELNPSQERLAEMVLKLEREVYQIKRPHQLARREVFVRIGEPIDLGQFIADYLKDTHAARHLVAEKLRKTLQSLIDSIGTSYSAGASEGPGQLHPSKG